MPDLGDKQTAADCTYLQDAACAAHASTVALDAKLRVLESDKKRGSRLAGLIVEAWKDAVLVLPHLAELFRLLAHSPSLDWPIMSEELRRVEYHLIQLYEPKEFEEFIVKISNRINEMRNDVKS
jgi:hypothetical protein